MVMRISAAITPCTNQYAIAVLIPAWMNMNTLISVGTKVIPKGVKRVLVTLRAHRTTHHPA